MKNVLKILTISGALYLTSMTSAFAWGLNSTGQQIGNFTMKILVTE